jgi:hypothetical protein
MYHIFLQNQVGGNAPPFRQGYLRTHPKKDGYVRQGPFQSLCVYNEAHVHLQAGTP